MKHLNRRRIFVGNVQHRPPPADYNRDSDILTSTSSVYVLCYLLRLPVYSLWLSVPIPISENKDPDTLWHTVGEDHASRQGRAEHACPVQSAQPQPEIVDVSVITLRTSN